VSASARTAAQAKTDEGGRRLRDRHDGDGDHDGD
jgi:hypothetical protein